MSIGHERIVVLWLWCRVTAATLTANVRSVLLGRTEFVRSGRAERLKCPWQACHHRSGIGDQGLVGRLALRCLENDPRRAFQFVQFTEAADPDVP